jgi:hypothetical protein
MNTMTWLDGLGGDLRHGIRVSLRPITPILRLKKIAQTRLIIELFGGHTI